MKKSICSNSKILEDASFTQLNEKLERVNNSLTTNTKLSLSLSILANHKFKDEIENINKCKTTLVKNYISNHEKTISKSFFQVYDLVKKQNLSEDLNIVNSNSNEIIKELDDTKTLLQEKTSFLQSTLEYDIQYLSSSQVKENIDISLRKIEFIDKFKGIQEEILKAQNSFARHPSRIASLQSYTKVLSNSINELQYISSQNLVLSEASQQSISNIKEREKLINYILIRLNNFKDLISQLNEFSSKLDKKGLLSSLDLGYETLEFQKSSQILKWSEYREKLSELRKNLNKIKDIKVIKLDNSNALTQLEEALNSYEDVLEATDFCNTSSESCKHWFQRQHLNIINPTPLFGVESDDYLIPVKSAIGNKLRNKYSKIKEIAIEPSVKVDITILQKIGISPEYKENFINLRNACETLWETASEYTNNADQAFLKHQNGE